MNVALSALRLTMQQIALACTAMLLSILVIALVPRPQVNPDVITHEVTQTEVLTASKLQEAYNNYLELYYRNDRRSNPVGAGVHQSAILDLAVAMKNRIEEEIDNPQSTLFREDVITGLQGSLKNAEQLTNDAIRGGTKAVLSYVDREGKRVEISVSDEELAILGLAKQQAAQTAISLPTIPSGKLEEAYLEQVSASVALTEANRDYKAARGRSDQAFILQTFIDPTGGIH